MASKLNGRELQKLRTRKDILRAAARLVKDGERPTMEAVAEAALVSRATLYRYFPNLDMLLAEATADVVMPDPASFFLGLESADAAERLDRAEAAMHEATYAQEKPLKQALAAALMLSSRGEAPMVPVRQNRRQPLIEAALEPLRHEVDTATWERLCAAAALVFGLESMVVYTDVMPMSQDEARAVKSWLLRALVAAARADGGAGAAAE